MSPLVRALIGSLMRAALLSLGAILVRNHWLTADQAGEAQERALAWLLAHAEIYGPIALAVGWSLVQKYGARLKQIAAADLPAGASDAQVAATAKTTAVKSMAFRSLVVVVAIALGAGALSTMPGCASVQTHVSTVADLANAGGKVQESAHAILEAATQANATIINGQPMVARIVLDDVALAVNKIGHAGLDLDAALNAYNAAKASGGDVIKQSAAVRLALNTIQSALTDIGKAIPNGTIAAIDQAAVTILGVIAQIKGAGL